MDLFSRSWTALRTAVAELPDEDFTRPSGCTGWLVRDLVCHLVIDSQDVLITLATPEATEPTRDAVTYWEVTRTPPGGDDPLDALTVRLAAGTDRAGHPTRSADGVAGRHPVGLQLRCCQQIRDQRVGPADVGAHQVHVTAQAPGPVLRPPQVGQLGERFQGHRGDGFGQGAGKQQLVPAGCLEGGGAVEVEAPVAVPQAVPAALGRTGVPRQDGDQNRGDSRRGRALRRVLVPDAGQAVLGDVLVVAVHPDQRMPVRAGCHLTPVGGGDRRPPHRPLVQLGRMQDPCVGGVSGRGDARHRSEAAVAGGASGDPVGRTEIVALHAQKPVPLGSGFAVHHAVVVHPAQSALSGPGVQGARGAVRVVIAALSPPGRCRSWR
ncbi:maleylpyruvate isomerase N-terminal domain-containing protein [Streptomyces sp. NBC_00111]